MLFKSHNYSLWVDLALKWCKKRFYKKILVLEIVQEKKLLYYTLNGMAWWLGSFSPPPPPMKGFDFKPHGVKPKEKCWRWGKGRAKVNN